MLRIWADGKLFHDKTGASPDVAKPSLRFRFHPGNETQLSDPLIEAHVGVGRAPAHRGLCLIVFEDLPLADYGNRIHWKRALHEQHGTKLVETFHWQHVEGTLDGVLLQALAEHGVAVAPADAVALLDGLRKSGQVSPFSELIGVFLKLHKASG